MNERADRHESASIARCRTRLVLNELLGGSEPLPLSEALVAELSPGTCSDLAGDDGRRRIHRSLDLCECALRS